MELIGFIQVFNIVIIAIGTLLYMCCRSLTFSSSTSSSSSGAAAVDDDNDDVDMPPLREKYDVFISFRGEDTHLTFTSHLHAALLREKIETYIDYKLKKGDEIGPALLEAIEKSRLSVIIFTKNYASSTWCLIELVHILKCKKKNGQMVVPIFYDISPSDVRKQKGSYSDAFAQLENRFKDRMDKVIEWKAALVEATGLCGSDYSNKKGTDAHFIEEIVDDISTKLKRETSYDLKGMVGIQSRIEEVKSLLSNNDSLDVCTVGIWGMGGCWINIKVSPDWFREGFLVFSLFVVVAFNHCTVALNFMIRCEYSFKTSSGESHEFEKPYYVPCLDVEMFWSYKLILDSYHFMNDMADSSSASDTVCQEKYYVFLSFRGVDTRDTFTSHLYSALVRKKIETYIDYKLESGDKIAPNLLEAIEKSKLSVVIFSKNYASSTWCLEELAHILECKDRYGQIVVPIFYGIDPSHVRKQQGSYGDAFAQLEQRFKDSMDKVLKWRAALTDAADISGFDASNKTGYSGILEIPDRLVCLTSLRGLDLRGTMVKWIPASIKQASRLSCLLLNNCKSLQSLPELPGVRWLEALGCTSLGKVSSLRTQLVQGRDDYEHGVYGRIPEKLIFSGCLKLDENARNSIMDDAHLRILRMAASHNAESLDGNSLVTIVCPGNEIPNWFGAQNEGSSINIRLPPNCFGSDFLGFVFSLLVEFDNYNVEQGLEFGCKSTLKGNSGKSHEFSCRLCDRLWGETQGEESNGYNFNSDHVFVWYNTFDLVGGAQCSTALHNGVTEASVEFYPKDHHDRPLNSYTVKVKRCGVRLLYAEDTKVAEDTKSLRSCDESEASGSDTLSPCKKQGDDQYPKGNKTRGEDTRLSFKVLIDKSLISIDSTRETIEMHDLLQEMGWAIVREQCVEEPGKCKRLFNAKDVYHVLNNNMLLNVDNSSCGQLNFSLDLPNSLCYLYCCGFPFKSLPSKSSPENLVEL
ncbi:hypothetical protein DVH24_034661 [Malus domestica]|uniref:TIR domain-containing protein n=1 Tax=Malus domestica TaxID=3750 RepID=A0A498J2T5_MALDO|nr:hypothetical protein DVH24_034661 [Malus domestica]